MLIYDLVNPTELTGYIRGLAFEENRFRFGLSEYLPDVPWQSTEFRITRGNLLDVDSAMARAFDAESPIAKRKTGTRIYGSIPPVSEKIPLGEEDTLRLNALRGGNADQNALVAKTYDDAGARTRAVLARIERWRGEALYSGKLVINENGVSGTVDYGRKSAHSVTAGVLWSDTANADPITDLIAWYTTYIDTNGVPPETILISIQTRGYLLTNTKIRQQAATAVGGTPTIVDMTTVNALLNRFELPSLTVFDERVRVAGVQTRVIPQNHVVFLPAKTEPLGGTLLGITAEALKLAGKGYLTYETAPGLTAVISEEDDPVTTWTKVAALPLPFLANPDLTFDAIVA